MSLLRRAALVPWLLPTLILGVVLGVALGIGARSLVREPAPVVTERVESEFVETGDALAPSVDAETDLDAEPSSPSLPELHFAMQASVSGTRSRPAVQLRGTPEAADSAALGGVVAYCQIARMPPWTLGDVEQPRKRRDDCWRDEEKAVTYEDVDVERGVDYSYEIRLYDAMGRLLATSKAADVLVAG